MCMCVCAYACVHVSTHPCLPYFLYSSADGHMGLFYYFAFVDNVALNMDQRLPCGTGTWSLSCKYTELVELGLFLECFGCFQPCKDFHRDRTNYSFHQQYKKVTPHTCTHSYQHLTTYFTMLCANPKCFKCSISFLLYKYLSSISFRVPITQVRYFSAFAEEQQCQSPMVFNFLQPPSLLLIVIQFIQVLCTPNIAVPSYLKLCFQQFQTPKINHEPKILNKKL